MPLPSSQSRSRGEGDSCRADAWRRCLALADLIVDDPAIRALTEDRRIALLSVFLEGRAIVLMTVIHRWQSAVQGRMESSCGIDAGMLLPMRWSFAAGRLSVGGS